MFLFAPDSFNAPPTLYVHLSLSLLLPLSDYPVCTIVFYSTILPLPFSVCPFSESTIHANNAGPAEHS